MIKRMGIFSLAGVMGAALLCAGSPADADIIFLKNGRPIKDAWIVNERGDMITIVIIKDGVEKGRMSIHRRQVRFVEQVGEKPNFLKARRTTNKPKVKFETLKPDTVDPLALEPKKKVEEKTEKVAPADKTKEGPFAADEQTREKMKGLFAQFASSSDDVRSAARRDVVAIGKPAIPGLIKRLGDKSLRVRTQAARGLSDMKDKSATQPLLEALYAGSPDKGKKVPRFNRNYMKSVVKALRGTTGQSFNYDANSLFRTGPAVTKWLEWWDGEKEAYPEQFTDPVIEKDDPEAKQKLLKARELKLSRTTFAPPKDILKQP